jgi:hypothetical protein
MNVDSTKMLPRVGGRIDTMLGKAINQTIHMESMSSYSSKIFLST